MPHRTPTSEVYAGMSLPEERQYLVTDNLRLVNYILNKYIKPAPSDYEDYEQIGRTGLIMAAIGWDESKGNTFATYATRMIWGYCKTYKRQTAPLVKYDHKTVDNYTHIQQLRETGLDDETIKAQLGITEIEFAEASFMYTPESLDRKTSNASTNEDVGTVADLIPASGGAEADYEDVDTESVFMEALAKTLEGIEQKQADIYEEYIYSLMNGETLRQQYFAEKYNLSQSYVSRIISKLNKRYRMYLRRQGIKA